MAAIAFGLGGVGLLYTLNRWKFLYKSVGEEMSPEKQERVKTIMRNVGYTDFTNVEMRFFEQDDIITIGGGDNVLWLMPRSFTATSEDSVSYLFPDKDSHALSSIKIADVEANPSLRTKLMNEYGIYIKTEAECDHLLTTIAFQSRDDYVGKFLKVQSGCFILFFLALSVLKRRTRLAAVPIGLGATFLANKRMAEALHEDSLVKTLKLRGPGSEKPAISLIKAEREFNVRWRGMSSLTTQEGDTLLYPPTAGKRLEMIDKYLKKPVEEQAQ